MASNDSEHDEELTGGQLRKKLEDALKTTATLSSELGKYKAAEVIAAKGYKLVTPEDLSGVGLAELEAKAAELEETKSKQSETVLRQVLSAKGLKDDQLEVMVKDLLGESPQEQNLASLGRIAAASRITGTAPAKANDPGLFGPARIRASFGKK